MKVILTLLVLMALARAEDIYVSQTAAGADNGSSCANSKSIAWLNTGSSWDQAAGGAGKVSHNDTVHLCGTITTAIQLIGGSDMGNLVTILFEPGCVMTSAAWDVSTGAILCQGTSYTTIDGGNVGIIRNTDNGTLLANQVGSVALKFTSCNYQVVKNLTILDMYVRVMGTDTAVINAIEMSDSAGGGQESMTLSNCVISHAARGAYIECGTNSRDFIVWGNTVSNCNWGVSISDRGTTSVLTNATIAFNRFLNWTNWDGTDAGSRAAHHHNGFYAFAASGGSIYALTIYNNHMGPNWNAQTDASQSTAGIFTYRVKGPILIYNNVFEESATSIDHPSTTLSLGSQGSGIFRIFNNTFTTLHSPGTFAITVDGDAGGLNAHITNNIVTNKSVISLSSWTAGDTAYIDNNIGFAPPSGAAYNYSLDGSSAFRTLSEWQSFGFDTHGTNVNPLLTSTFRLGAGSPAIGYGANINSFFTTDYDGVTRGSVWDAGAFEFVAPDLTRTVNVSGTLRVGTMTVP